MKSFAVPLGALLVAVGISVRASMPVPLPLKELYADADTVALVEIVEGHVVTASGETCGARYRGRVIEGAKGAAVGSVVEFGYLPSLKMGSTYLILLEKFANAELPGLPDFKTRCKSVLPQAAISANWRGAMEVEGDTSNLTKRASWTVRPPKYVIFPLGTRTTVVDGEKRYWFADVVGRMRDEK
jgi:hypothetical protein